MRKNLKEKRKYFIWNFRGEEEEQKSEKPIEEVKKIFILFFFSQLIFF